MKKLLIKACTFAIVFVISLVIISRFMNKDHDNLTMEMAAASLPVVSMEQDGWRYNFLPGYKEPMKTAFQRDCITVLGENRDSRLQVDTYGREVTGISIQVRNVDGSRLIEDSPVDFSRKGTNRIVADIALKDLIEKNTEYSLTVIMELDGEETVYYYSRVIWGDQLYASEKLGFIRDFHDRLYDKEAAKTLTRYLETDPGLADNTSLHKVNIHNSFHQITWGDLPVKEVGEPVLQLTAIADQTASVSVKYTVAMEREEDPIYFLAEEYYRVRYTPERMYLLDYERTVTQIPQTDSLCVNDKVSLGITDPDVPMMESADGNIVVFEAAGKLCSYNLSSGELTVLFSFYDEKNADARTILGEHAIKILDVDEGGNVHFAVYGYMNRGRHEGEVGFALYAYDHSVITTEELVYIPYRNTFAVLEAEMSQLLYLGREQKLYCTLGNTVYEIDTVARTYEPLVKNLRDGSMHVSDNHRIIVWQEENHQDQFMIKNLNSDSGGAITVGADEVITPLGFMGEDVIYGVARRTDIVEESSGRIFTPMYKMCICDSDGVLLKSYEQESIYVTSCSVTDNQITLERVQRDEQGIYREIEADHITNNQEEAGGRNYVVTAAIELFQEYVEIQLKSKVDPKNYKVLTPKEVVYEGGRTLLLEEKGIDRYYVYGPYGVHAICSEPGHAVNLAYEIAGIVSDETGNCIWLRGNRVARNQIMAITGQTITEEKNSLAVCLDSILLHKGVIRNSEYLLGQGQSVMEILEENIPDTKALDLSGCTLDAVLYYVNRDIPVLALLADGEAVLVTGFNEYNVVVMNPNEKEPLYKMGINDATEWFRENGNHFVTYMTAE